MPNSYHGRCMFSEAHSRHKENPRTLRRRSQDLACSKHLKETLGSGFLKSVFRVSGFGAPWLLMQALPLSQIRWNRALVAFKKRGLAVAVDLVRYHVSFLDAGAR